jgi:colanic acid/amylovoran biosynthesis glycosyltransferase
VNLDQPKHRAATRRMLGLARLVLVRSESLRERLVKMGCDAGKIRVHRTGIPVDELAFRQRSVPEDGAWRCVQACRLIPKKGITTAIRTFAAFQKEFPKARLTVAGEGIERDKAWRLALDLGIQGKVNFTGFMSQPELRALYNDAHIFIHPSQMGEDGDQEGVPNAILEAMAMGVPILATRHGGIPEAVEHNVSGLLVEERDHEAAARELLALARDPARYAAMSAAAGARVRSIFDVKATAAALEAIYDEARGQI